MPRPSIVNYDVGVDAGVIVDVEVSIVVDAFFDDIKLKIL